MALAHYLHEVDEYEFQLYRCYMVDQAVFALGSALQENLEKIEHKNPAMVEMMRNQELARVLGKASAPKQRFRDPASLFAKGGGKDGKPIAPPPKPFPEN